MNTAKVTHAKVTRVWHKVEITCYAVASEAIEYALMEAGAIGTETQDENFRTETLLGEIQHVENSSEESSIDFRQTVAHVIAYFDELPDMHMLDAKTDEALRIYSLPVSVLHAAPVIGETPARDWLAEWKRSWQPIAVGRSFIVAPSWSDVPLAEDKHIVRIEPGMAFGTGTHETTRLCLTLIERFFDGASFLDVGTGTGILAIAAALLNPLARIEACDTDGEAVEIARENARVNRVEDRILFRVGTVDDEAASADCVCANLTADVILPMLPALLAATCGRLILSGVLTSQVETVRARLTELGTTTCEVVTDGEWAAIVV